MNMTSIKCFMKVAELRSFSRAADALYLSQQSVSLHIKRLEDTYSTKLFERKPSLKLTSAGKLLLEAAADIVAREDELLASICLSREDFGGNIVIGIPPNRSAPFAIDFVPRIAGLYPKMTLSLREMPSSHLLQALQLNEVDLALVLVSNVQNNPDPRFFVSVRLINEIMFLLVSDTLMREHFSDAYARLHDSFKNGVDVLAFANFPMILRPFTSATHAEIVEHFAAHFVKPKIRIQSTSTSALLPLCASGFGVVFCASSVLRYLRKEYPSIFQRINIYPVVKGCNERQLLLVYHKKKSLTPPLRDCIDIIKDAFLEPST